MCGLSTISYLILPPPICRANSMFSVFNFFNWMRFSPRRPISLWNSYSIIIRYLPKYSYFSFCSKSGLCHQYLYSIFRFVTRQCITKCVKNYLHFAQAFWAGPSGSAKSRAFWRRSRIEDRRSMEPWRGAEFLTHNRFFPRSPIDI